MNKTKDNIFYSAIKVFSNNGYNGATMDEIASNAGVAKGTLYYHFKSKEEIFKYIIEEGVNLMKNEIDEATDKEKTALEKLKAVCRVQLNLIYKNRDFFKVIASQLWGKELRQLELRDIMRNYVVHIEEFVKDAMEAGSIKKGNSLFVAYAFLGTLCSVSLYEVINAENDNINNTIENLMNYILNGIGLQN
ncbi:transcriptional regulator, TetR family [Clostridium pasteurianum DSM 525 = ATCC 6013]|uniref:Transcriptional regulator, TetR family n=2 Tax=Clostridium pasteurianum TaxID=1501 RepID=A0A0H3J0H1_CLOPA|nr:TetR/AcrR family transcriptional regulator [Clostridium pasteurianum]AJA46162.1 transcriptional regulator, TetR family [Clostridium pasteurianum DSM 525 = ATCC 6013]AJA50150.1 transcriptional regulator, TetR family [Clostridium pasteurianum DSM 525 = ATCC 6013]AOZ73622.1 TetR family transcriptional regulator [Clostridium pasteurianum DSM 525 = ATCC 6013]AOZ77419.1 TetR family transcriptional regulator [Clostridium pasteurianum]ELP57752.1 TetR family transcriptional regulator [Clostridium pa